MKKYIVHFCLFLAMFAMSGCSLKQPTQTKLYLDSEQLLVAVGNSSKDISVKIYAFEKIDDKWKLQLGAFDGVTGRSGFAPFGEKKEGDGFAPTGLFALEFAFGYEPTIKSKMPYLQAKDDDIWVDDINSTDYNSWTKLGKTTAPSHEEMKRKDHLYRHGLVTSYNRTPIIKGDGSGIFVHIWRDKNKPTSGCIALDEQELIEILKWLDPLKRPKIFMGKQSDLEALSSEFAQIKDLF